MPPGILRGPVRAPGASAAGTARGSPGGGRAGLGRAGAGPGRVQWLPRWDWGTGDSGDGGELAFVGDAVWDLYVRADAVAASGVARGRGGPAGGSNAGDGGATDLRAIIVDAVRAEAQAESLGRLYDHLTASERKIVADGQDAAQQQLVPSRLRRTGAEEAYRRATGLETLLGFLFFEDPERLHALMATLGMADTEDGFFSLYVARGPESDPESPGSSPGFEARIT